MKKKFVKAEIHWTPQKKSLQSEARVYPILRFEDDAFEESSWSADIQINTVNENECNDAFLTYLSEDAPFSKLYSGHKFSLYEGSKLIAYGEVK